MNIQGIIEIKCKRTTLLLQLSAFLAILIFRHIIIDVWCYCFHCVLAASLAHAFAKHWACENDKVEHHIGCN